MCWIGFSACINLIYVKNFFRCHYFLVQEQQAYGTIVKKKQQNITTTEVFILK